MWIVEKEGQFFEAKALLGEKCKITIRDSYKFFAFPLADFVKTIKNSKMFDIAEPKQCWDMCLNWKELISEAIVNFACKEKVCKLDEIKTPEYRT